MRRLLALPCLCACLTVPSPPPAGQEDHRLERRSPLLPALTEPFTTTVAELLRPGEVPAEVQEQLAASLLRLPAQLQKEWDGFHYWKPRIEANADRRQQAGEGKGAFLKDANYYSRDRRAVITGEPEELDQAIANLDSVLSTIRPAEDADYDDRSSRQKTRRPEELYGHSHGPHVGKSLTYRRLHGQAKRSAAALGALAHLDRMLGVLGGEREDGGLGDLRGAAAGVVTAWQEVEQGQTDTAYEELIKAEVQLKKILNNLEGTESKVIGTEAAEHMLDSALHRLFQAGPGQARSRRSAAGEEEPTLSAEALAWLEEQYNLTRADVEEIQALPETEFRQLEAALEELQLQEADLEEADLEGGVGILDIIREARQLVPLEVEAATAGVLELGAHLSDRALSEARPAYRLVAEHSSALLTTATDYVPDEVAAWAEEGGHLAERYLGPRLARLGASVERIQGRLVSAAEDVGPRVVPALQAMAEELRDVIQAAREAVVPALERAGRGLVARVPEEVKDRVEPVAAGLRQELAALYTETGRPLVEEGRSEVARLGDTIKHKVAPAIKSAVKKTLHGVFTGLPRLVQKLSHEAHGAAKVFRGRYSDKLAKLRSKKTDPVQML